MLCTGLEFGATALSDGGVRQSTGWRPEHEWREPDLTPVQSALHQVGRLPMPAVLGTPPPRATVRGRPPRRLGRCPSSPSTRRPVRCAPRPWRRGRRSWPSGGAGRTWLATAGSSSRPGSARTGGRDRGARGVDRRRLLGQPRPGRLGVGHGGRPAGERRRARRTTNQRMEIQAALEAVRALRGPLDGRQRLDLRRQLLPRRLVEGWLKPRLGEQREEAGGQPRPVGAARRRSSATAAT